MITRTIERINHETGEVVETQNEIVRKETKEEYVRFFLRSIEGKCTLYAATIYH